MDATRSFADLAVNSGVSRLTLLSGRGEPEAERAEQAVRATGAELTILRSTWFMQNFSEDYMLEHVLAGEIRLYELTGPRSLTFAQAAAEIGEAVGRELRYTPVSLEQHEAERAEHGVAPT